MLKALMNKLPCRVGPRNTRNLAYDYLKENNSLTNLPEDIDFVESYIFDYNRFLALGKNLYVKLNIFYSDLTNLSDIKSAVIQLK